MYNKSGKKTHCEHIENDLYEHIDGLKSIPLYHQKDAKKK